MLNRRVNVEIEEDEEGTTKWYIGVIKEVKEGSCTMTSMALTVRTTYKLQYKKYVLMT